jgi:hypothetical protein
MAFGMLTLSKFIRPHRESSFCFRMVNELLARVVTGLFAKNWLPEAGEATIAANMVNFLRVIFTEKTTGFRPRVGGSVKSSQKSLNKTFALKRHNGVFLFDIFILQNINIHMENKRGNVRNGGNWLLRRVVLCVLYLAIIGSGFGGY